MSPPQSSAARIIELVSTDTELQPGELTDNSEENFRHALDELLDVISDNQSSTTDRSLNLLNIGIKYLAMSSGMIASTMGNKLQAITLSGEIANTVNPGDQIPLDHSLCNCVMNTDEVVAVHDMQRAISSGEFKPVTTNTEAYIGTQVLTANGPLGVVNFSSKQARENPFSEQEKKLVALIANWVGAVLGNEEQLEFLSLQNDYYQSLFQTVPAMLILCNKDGLIISTSKRLSSILGIEPLSIPGRNCKQFFIEQDADQLRDALVAGNIEHLPLTLQIDNGDTLDVELNSSIKHLGSMQGVRMIVLADVSERNQAFKAVEDQNRQLAIVNESLNQFAFMASHDLQEPLRKIQQFSQFLEEDLGKAMTEEGRYHLDVIVNSATRMSTLIHDLLEFSSAAKGGIELAQIDLTELMGEVSSELELRIQESNAQLVIEDLPVVSGDKTLVRQLFINLIGNSIKYRDNERTPVIKVGSYKQDGKLTITVTDNGIGFDQANASRAFEPFSRLHKDKKYSGNGIGLSICATVCEKHNWNLSVSSQPGKGSVFSITLNCDDTNEVSG